MHDQAEEKDKGHLRQIRERVEEYGEIISGVTGADIEIVDRNGGKIYATGMLIDNGKLIGNGLLYEECCREKKPVVIHNPRRHELCENCPDRDRCLEKAEMAFPIMGRDGVLGALGLLCSSIYQKNAVFENLRDNMYFINKMLGFMTDWLYAAPIQPVDANSEDSIRPLEDIEMEYIERAVQICGDTTEGKKEAAQRLNIGLATLYRKLRSKGQ